ncbi:MAG: FAD-binding oxidoreductase [Candidatus Zixiibacteriota bacterium]
MISLDQFIEIIASEFPKDRLTWQKGIPTFHPESADDAARFLKLVNTHRRTTFFTSFGNNIDPVGERFADLVTLRTDRLNDLLEVAPGDFYVTVGSGYPLREINQHITVEHLYMPHSALPYVGSVGGAVAVNLSARLHQYDLTIKKYLIKAEIVTPEGEIVTPGSVCFKSVSGYDIVKLFAGSWGLLGLIISATFRVLPDSAAHEYESMKMNAVDRASFLAGLDSSNNDTDAVYSRKIKAKIDPNGVLPVV